MSKNNQSFQKAKTFTETMTELRDSQLKRLQETQALLQDVRRKANALIASIEKEVSGIIAQL